MMKKNWSIQSTLIFLLVVIVLSLPALSFAGEYVSVKKDGVNIRSGPSTDDEILYEVFKDFPLEVLQRKGDWVQTRDYENDKGWIYASLLSDKTTVIVKVDTANMRSGPGTENKIIATVKKGVVFKPIGKEGDWIKLQYKNDITGWMYNTLLWPSNF
jgi:SH3-like domain-containing protein